MTVAVVMQISGHTFFVTVSDLHLGGLFAYEALNSALAY